MQQLRRVNWFPFLVSGKQGRSCLRASDLYLCRDSLLIFLSRPTSRSEGDLSRSMRTIVPKVKRIGGGAFFYQRCPLKVGKERSYRSRVRSRLDRFR